MDRVSKSFENSHQLAAPSRHDRVRLFSKLAIALCLTVLLSATPAFAQARYIEEPTIKDHFFKLVQSSFGTLLMVFSGLGGMVTLYFRREGDRGNEIPFLGIALLLFAAFLFVMRIMIKSGMMGADYLDFGS